MRMQYTGIRDGLHLLPWRWPPAVLTPPLASCKMPRRVANKRRGFGLNQENVMSLTGLVIWLVVGGIVGWLAGLIVKGGGMGLIGNIVVGIVGAFLAGWLLPMLGISIGGGIVAAIIHALIGAVILLAVLGIIKRA
jgi:uncharacterized membrane protein YeaQ/YmgE (transglycosylase-associated protein family)